MTCLGTVTLADPVTGAPFSFYVFASPAPIPVASGPGPGATGTP